ncbi:MAG TPA: hypothetical protein VFG72_14670 [Marmoricola sp.]|nr:hypothetical protein [Marmoricola sp.]
MELRVLRAAVAALLGLSGALMYAGSWQRWAGACSWGEVEGGGCDLLQDHRYDFVAPSAPWEPVGDAAQLAGWSLLVLALAFVLLPWAFTGRRPGVFAAAAVVGAALALVAVGAATLRSGLTGSVVHPFASDLALFVWFLVPPILLIRWAVTARGWAARAAAVWLVLASPLVAAFSYAIGPYDSQPWWEAISGMLTATAGLCLLAAAAFSDRSGRRETASAGAATTVEHGTASFS